MSVQEVVQQLEYASVADRIQAIELLLLSLKNEFSRDESALTVHQPFRVRAFDLGTDVQIDREEMHMDRLF